MLRIALVPLVVILIIIDRPLCKWLALAVFAAASLTDLIDGRLARRNNQVTDLGKFLDPLADKALICSVLICFIGQGMASVIAVIVVVFREFLVSGIRLAAVNKGRVIAANRWGKIKTASQMVTVSLVLFLQILSGYSLISVSSVSSISKAAVWITAALTAVSGYIYLKGNMDVLKESKG
jgi:CDP-diacylglycerol--glycerol-3-phosphate 3-phosphatidyltransferase